MTGSGSFFVLRIAIGLARCVTFRLKTLWEKPMCIACSPFGAALGAGFSRRTVIGDSARLAMGSAATGFGGLFACDGMAQPGGGGGSAEAIYTGGPILTMVDAMPNVEAIAVRGGRIIAVGTRAEVEATRGLGTRSIDLGGRTLLPGFFDAHGHVMMCGLQAKVANLLPAPDGEGNDVAAIQRLLRGWMTTNQAAVRRYGVVIGFGYDESQLKEQRPLNRDELNAVSADLPVMIVHTSGHLGVLNSKALETVGITAASEDPVGGTIFRAPGSREPNGLLSETAWLGALGKLLARLDQDAALAMLRAGCEAYASFGYTTATEGRASAGLVSIFGLAAQRALLPIDTIVYPDFEVASDATRTASRHYRNRFRIGGGKLTFDGSPQGKTAWLSQPYFVPPPSETPDFCGQSTLTSDAAFALVDKAFANKIHLLVHCNGDAASDLLIATVKAATAKHGGGDRRTVLIHGQVLREDQVDAIRELGIIPSLFPMHTFYWGDWHHDSVLGPARVENISPTGWCLRRGMIFSSHHDAPVAKPDSIRVLSATVTRRSRSGHIIGAHQRVSPWVALKALTIWPAHHYWESETKGSLEVGKIADFAILSDNPMTMDPERLVELKVTETIKEGVSVYHA